MRGIDSSFGSSSRPITLDNVVCTGSESNLFECSHNEILQNNCEHSEDVAVVCGGKHSTQRIRTTASVWIAAVSSFSTMHREQCETCQP